MFRAHMSIIRCIRCWVAVYGFLHRVFGWAVACRAWHHLHRTHDPRSGSQDHHPSKNSVQKTICFNSTSDAPDDGSMYPKHVELRILTYLITYLLTHSMMQSPSWAANWFAASQEIPRISRNPKVHYRTDERLPPVHILGQPNPVHIPTSHLLEILPNIVHPSTPRSPQWSPFLWFPHQDPIHSPLPTDPS